MTASHEMPSIASGYMIDILVHGYPGRSVCHGSLGWSTIALLRGHGRVWLQSLPFSRLADRVIQSAPSFQGKDKGEGSVLGGLGRLVDGD